LTQTLQAEIKTRAVHADVHGTGTPEYRGGALYFHATSQIRFSNMRVEKKENAGRLAVGRGISGAGREVP